MAIKKVRIRPEGENNYADIIHPETSADIVVDTPTKVVMTKEERDKLSGIQAGANKTTIDNTLTSTSTTQALSANQGKVLDNKINNLSTNVDTELSKKINTTEKGNVNGLAELDAGGKVPASQLPSYVDDVLEFSSLSTFPTTGETGKIYVATNTNLTYRWSGTGYVEISPSIALGETSSTAYRGDRGKIAYDHSQSTHARIDATKTESSTINGNVKINGTETNVYTHPANHDDRYYTETEIDTKLSDKVDNLRVLTDVPTNAKFTDTNTITTINGKTGVIAKADIVALGILAQDTELRLGNFKLVFNEVENSLDFEVLA